MESIQYFDDGQCVFCGEPNETSICNCEKQERHIQFVEACFKANIPVRFYRGRWYYKGPAAVTNQDDDIMADDIIIATGLRLTRDNMGLELVLYP